MRLIAAFLLLSAFCHFAEAQEPEKPSLFPRALHIFDGKPATPNESATKRLKQLTLTLKLQPERVVLPQTRQIRVALEVVNHSKRFVRLEFPTTQRIEVVLREKEGRNLVQWSEDRSFSTEPSYVTINPGERVEYEAKVPTRDLVAGRLYEVEAFFPSYPDMRVSNSLEPVK